MARPLKGDTPRKNVMIRLEDSEKELLIKHFGGVQSAVDVLLNQVKYEEAIQKNRAETKAGPQKRSTWTDNQKQLRRELKLHFEKFKISRSQYGGINIFRGSAYCLTKEQEEILKNYEVHFDDYGFDVDKKKEKPR